MSFLKRSPRPGSQEVLLMYYLQRSRYAEAVALDAELSAAGRASQTRRAIMDKFCKANLIPKAVLAR